MEHSLLLYPIHELDTNGKSQSKGCDKSMYKLSSMTEKGEGEERDLSSESDVIARLG